MKFARLLSYALTIGEKMLCSGAEVSRVEDSIVRICSAYGSSCVNVFTITSSNRCMNTNKFFDTDKKVLLDLICNEQVHMIIKDHNNYESDKYKRLERLKVLVKDL